MISDRALFPLPAFLAACMLVGCDSGPGPTRRPPEVPIESYVAAQAAETPPPRSDSTDAAGPSAVTPPPSAPSPAKSGAPVKPPPPAKKRKR